MNFFGENGKAESYGDDFFAHDPYVFDEFFLFKRGILSLGGYRLRLRPPVLVFALRGKFTYYGICTYLCGDVDVMRCDAMHGRYMGAGKVGWGSCNVGYVRRG